MPAYPTDPNIIRDILDLKRRVKILEAQMANRTGSTGGAGGTVYDANVIWNGSIESGLTGWSRSFYTGTRGVTAVEAADPLDGLYSLRVDEQASSSTRIIWSATGNVSAPTVGSDVFDTAPGDIWRITALMRSTVATAHAKIYGVCGTTAADCYGIPGGGGRTYVAAADVPLVAGTTATLSGLITVPATRNYITFSCSPDDMAGSSGVPWSWWLDDVTLQKQL